MKQYRLTATRIYRVLSLIFYLSIAPLQAQRELTVATWGGAYENAQRIALFEPFEAETGIRIETQFYNGDQAILKSDSIPDVIDMTLDDALVACDENLLHKVDFGSMVSPSPAGVKAENDFIENSILPCGIAHLTYSNLIAYDDRAFPGAKPQLINDFFDLERFPGKRALYKEPSAILEWALMAEGVPLDQIYDLLSTDRGLRLAFRRLDSIRDQIVWWDNPKQPAAFLKAGKVVMASGYNGRFFDAQLQGDPINMIWDGQIIDRDVWAIPKAKEDLSEAVRKFIGFVTQTSKMAKLAEIIPYGPTRKSALKHIGLHPQKGIQMREHLPTASHHLDRALFRDANWYARTLKFRNQRFWDWFNAN